MTIDGRRIEQLVSFVEGELLPPGFTVKSNERIYNSEGIQIAEFDIEILGKVGSTSFSWLIECRDRPSQGPAPASWIEQLVGRRERFGFNKVTAVSTTGFASGASDFARREGIELREVSSLTPEAFDWLMLRHFRLTQQNAKLMDATIHVSGEVSEVQQGELLELLKMIGSHEKRLISSSTGRPISLADAFLGAVKQAKLFDGMDPRGETKRVALKANYPNEQDSYVIDMKQGQIRIDAIQFKGELCVSVEDIPLAITEEYRRTETGEPISQVAAFAPHTIQGKQVSLEFHHFVESGESMVVMRAIPPASKTEREGTS
jgi:hypothetical protein